MSTMTDLQGAWIATIFLLVVISVLAAVLQQFTLHFALARARVQAPEIAGLRLIALWAPTIAVWIAAGLAIGLTHAHPRTCNSADASGLWLGILYPLTAWPPVWLARQLRVPIPGWYWIAQLFPALSLILLSGLPCLV